MKRVYIIEIYVHILHDLQYDYEIDRISVLDVLHCFVKLSTSMFIIFRFLNYKLCYFKFHTYGLETSSKLGNLLVNFILQMVIPKGTTHVLFKGKPTKVAYAILYTLCQRGVKVIVQLHEEEYAKLNTTLDANSASNLVPSSNYSPKIWLVGDGVTEEEQLKACKGTIFIPFTQFPPKKARKDCIYLCTPAMVTPLSLENVHACECLFLLILHVHNWLPRRVMSAWRIAGIVHALEGWNEHKCGDTISNIDQVWKATLGHGFQPILNATQTNY
ncbi:hypothetical protein UlMin_036894 [Ulmus minor]